ncbi:hypothetical protein EIB96_04025 [Vibrio parahaemolyticus]|nr:hypothetical protein [Vibrio parahaemolyticus]EGR0921813.1 hypothetical protein [Vibrio parahaemolyticus]EGR0987526.1 hypothetical protein [Vibrio parahaemolyticus]EGR1371351.1 hypothetical protein [Vibrio parahaemolyticus]EGR1949919.1 hypothetical protein [Vibrio parahaemolyticus]
MTEKYTSTAHRCDEKTVHKAKSLVLLAIHFVQTK